MEKEKNCEQMTCDCQPFEHSLQKESEWEGVFQLVMEDIGKRYRVSDELFDVLSDSLSKHLPEAITTVVSNREKEIAEEVEEMLYNRPQWAFSKDAIDALKQVLQILKH